MPKQKNKPPKETKKEKKARINDGAQTGRAANTTTSKSAAAALQAAIQAPVQQEFRARTSASPSASTHPTIPPEFLVEIEGDDARHEFIRNALIRVKEIADLELSVKNELVAFHEKIGKVYASQMTSKEKEQANTLYARLTEATNGHQEYMFALINRMKKWRLDAADVARDKGEVNALEYLNLKHGCLPLMDCNHNREPYGTGALAWPDKKRLEKKEPVVAFVETSKTWIMAEVSRSVSNQRYECLDIDDEDKKVATFARKQLIPLPQFTCDYQKFNFMAFKPNAHVLALYPGTTCFYPGRVDKSPDTSSGKYIISFVDTDDAKKFSKPSEVSEGYVVAYRKDPKMYVRPEKRAQLALETVVTVAEITDDKDIPGPAPKPKAPSYYESPDEENSKNFSMKKKRKKQEGDEICGRQSKPKVEKVKIRRAKVPPHKKIRSTRLFGKRRKIKKAKTVNPTSEEPSSATIESSSKDREITHEEIQEQESGDVELSASRSVSECSRELGDEFDDDKLDDTKSSAEDDEDEAVDDEDESENISNSDEDNKLEVTRCIKDNESDGKRDTVKEKQDDELAHDPEEGTSGGYNPIVGYGIESDSDDYSSCHSSTGSYVTDNKKDEIEKKQEE
uniref:SGF29 C-terminal domain-containing protein n=1 Tax=Caenorhabditis japonica TaxID=281687 RepID=A0A8R1DMJ9_CAEJA